METGFVLIEILAVDILTGKHSLIGTFDPQNPLRKKTNFVI